MNQSHAGTLPIEALGADARARFVVRTYNHLFGATLYFVLLQVALFKSGVAETIARTFLSVNWLFVLGGFILVSWLATHAAHRAADLRVQYLALLGFVTAEALVFVPLLYVANHYAPGAIQSAALITLLAFAALTGIAFWTRKDFSFLGAVLRWAGIVALLAIVAGVIFGFQLGTWFSVAMVGLAGAAILYDTSNVLHRYPQERYVAAALELFASMALMFWYVLRLLTSRD
jgi:FtsH-binding integral membrane protein